MVRIRAAYERRAYSSPVTEVAVIFWMNGDTTLALLDTVAIAVVSEVVDWTEAAETVLPAGILTSYSIFVEIAGADSMMLAIVGIGPGAALMLAFIVSAKAAVSAIFVAISAALSGSLDLATYSTAAPDAPVSCRWVRCMVSKRFRLLV